MKRIEEANITEVLAERPDIRVSIEVYLRMTAMEMQM